MGVIRIVFRYSKGQCSAKDASQGDLMLGGQLAWLVAHSMDISFLRDIVCHTNVSGYAFA